MNVFIVHISTVEDYACLMMVISFTSCSPSLKEEWLERGGARYVVQVGGPWYGVRIVPGPRAKPVRMWNGVVGCGRMRGMRHMHMHAARTCTCTQHMHMHAAHAHARRQKLEFLKSCDQSQEEIINNYKTTKIMKNCRLK